MVLMHWIHKKIKITAEKSAQIEMLVLFWKMKTIIDKICSYKYCKILFGPFQITEHKLITAFSGGTDHFTVLLGKTSGHFEWF